MWLFSRAQFSSGVFEQAFEAISPANELRYQDDGYNLSKFEVIVRSQFHFQIFIAEKKFGSMSWYEIKF
jgi:hypothetical protein